MFRNLDTGVDIDAKENGRVISAKYHTGADGIHPRGWNQDWAAWVEEQKKAGLPINESTMKTQLEIMMNSDKYKDPIGSVF